MPFVQGYVSPILILAYMFGIDPARLPEIDGSNAVYLAIPFIALLVGQWLFKKLVNGVDPKLSFEDKLPTYTTAAIVRWAMLEGGALLLVILAPEFFLIGLLLILYMVWLRPTRFRIESELV
ncbi:MFS transporter [Sediminicola luteus]|uniref:MFS transporter n=1 Tax=Sediminicola luteus TaxID=319238 RepID=UPI001143FCAD|nr:MFS transporter [Sediminicola luteus]